MKSIHELTHEVVVKPQRDLHLRTADDENLLAVVKILGEKERSLVNRDREIDLEDVGLENDG